MRIKRQNILGFDNFNIFNTSCFTEIKTKLANICVAIVLLREYFFISRYEEKRKETLP